MIYFDPYIQYDYILSDEDFFKYCGRKDDYPMRVYEDFFASILKNKYEDIYFSIVEKLNITLSSDFDEDYKFNKWVESMEYYTNIELRKNKLEKIINKIK